MVLVSDGMIMVKYVKNVITKKEKGYIKILSFFVTLIISYTYNSNININNMEDMNLLEYNKKCAKFLKWKQNNEN